MLYGVRNLFMQSRVGFPHKQFDMVIGSVAGFDDTKGFRRSIFAHAVSLAEIQIREEFHYFSRRV